MRRATLVILSVLLASGTGVDARQAMLLQKLDPILRLMVIKQESGAAPGTSLPIIHLREPGVVNTIVKVSGNPLAMESTGARVRSVIGDIVTADVPLYSLADLIELPNVFYVQAARQMEPALLDASVPNTKADQVWRSVPGYTGKGVIVGVIDTGIDWKHPDFRTVDGTSRILYIWDQMVQTPGQTPMDYEYGTEWTKAHIDSGQCQEMDASGHGTHVASIIAGDGRNRHQFTGVAPEAEIIVVKSGFADADVLDAANYIFSRAAELNKPAVINMSFGGHWGPHDGTTLMDQGIDELLDQPGRAVVAGAGNSGSDTKHLGVDSLRRPANGSYPWVAVRPTIGVQIVMVQAWYAPEKSLSVRLLLPENDEGDLSDLDEGWVSEGQFRLFSVPDGPLTGAEVLIEARLTASPQTFPNFDGIHIHISDNGDLTIPIDKYIYAIEFKGAGLAFDAYVVRDGDFVTELPASGSFPDESFLMEGDGSKTIISPASASRAICVGSYITKSEWIDSENRLRTDELEINEISDFSSRGPLLNEGQKPDIAAPGERITAALSADGWSSSRSIYRDGEHVLWRGTSMAAPHATGAVALIYEQNPRLTATTVKNMLTRTAQDRGEAGWDEAWGYGKLDVLAAMGIPSAPGGLEVAAENGAITVTWLPNKEADIAGYKLDAGYLIQDTGFQHRTFDIQHPESTHRITDLPDDVPVSISISAYSDSGEEGPKSQEITVISSLSVQDVTPPKPPENLTAISIDTALELTWNRNSEHDLAGYKVYYGTSSGNYDDSTTVGRVTKYRIEGLTNDVRLYIAVSSIDTSGNESERSEEVSAIPQLFPRPELPYQSGWPMTVENDLYSSPTLYDVNGDGRLEVAISARDGNVYLLRHDGSHVEGWPVSTGLVSVSSPALGDVDGDGRIEIVVGAGDSVFMWRDDGSPVDGWPIKMHGSVLASPALGDIDGDGRMEVVIGSLDNRLHVYNDNGSHVRGWPVKLYGQIYSSAAIADIDGDNRLEIVIGSRVGNVYAFEGDGTRTAGWPVHIESGVSSSPAIGDIDGDGSMEVVVGDEGGQAYAWRYDGKPVEGWPVDLRKKIVASPALGDLDGDKGTLEVVIGVESGLVYALHPNGSNMNGWPVAVSGTMTSSPALGDIDSDGSVEVIVATSNGHHYVGLVYVFRNTGGELAREWPVHFDGNVEYSSPALGDLDADGDIELVVGSCRPNRDEEGKVHVWDLDGRWKGAEIPWAGFRHDPHHTGTAGSLLTQVEPPSEPTQEPPSKSSFLPNYPNPFEKGTWIPYRLSKDSSVRIMIYNISGQLVKTMDLGLRFAGYYDTEGEAAYWNRRNENGERVSAGVYFYQITAGYLQTLRKMAIAR